MLASAQNGGCRPSSLQRRPPAFISEANEAQMEVDEKAPGAAADVSTGVGGGYDGVDEYEHLCTLVCALIS
jgi:hypothetical protein